MLGLNRSAMRWLERQADGTIGQLTGEGGSRLLSVQCDSYRQDTAGELGSLSLIRTFKPAFRWPITLSEMLGHSAFDSNAPADE
jgi:hypothetical protein